jgi:hypothetical protein
MTPRKNLSEFWTALAAILFQLLENYTTEHFLSFLWLCSDIQTTHLVLFLGPGPYLKTKLPKSPVSDVQASNIQMSGIQMFTVTPVKLKDSVKVCLRK